MAVDVLNTMYLMMDCGKLSEVPGYPVRASSMDDIAPVAASKIHMYPNADHAVKIRLRFMILVLTWQMQDER